jgi:hypothetical protein
MVKGYRDVLETVDTIVHRLEDVEDDMQVCKTDIDVTRIQLLLVEREIRLLDGSMENAHKGLEDLGDPVDGFVSSIRTYSNHEITNNRALGLESRESSGSLVRIMRVSW